jgi:hypothetical protein
MTFTDLLKQHPSKYLVFFEELESSARMNLSEIEKQVHFN